MIVFLKLKVKLRSFVVCLKISSLDSNFIMYGVKCTVQLQYTHYNLVLVGSNNKNAETDMQIVNTN